MRWKTWDADSGTGNTQGYETQVKLVNSCHAFRPRFQVWDAAKEAKHEHTEHVSNSVYTEKKIQNYYSISCFCDVTGGKLLFFIFKFTVNISLFVLYF